jgi:hypothetical protein
MQVTINANNRVLNAKLVQFNPKGFKTFIAWHGNSNYEQINLKDILMSYAYDPTNKSYDFLTILKELKMKTQVKQQLLILKSLLIQYQSKIIKTLCIIGMLLLIYLSSFNFLNMSEVSLNHNIIDGTVTCDTTRGMKLSAPWILVSVIDTRPIRVCIDCSCRNITCKLVYFNPKEYKIFVQKKVGLTFGLEIDCHLTVVIIKSIEVSRMLFVDTHLIM